MSPSLRPISISDGAGSHFRVEHLVGIDESGNDATGGVCVTVAVRTQRETDIALVRNLVENGLKPFQHKSSTLLRYESLDQPDRKQRVENFIRDLNSTPITWAAVVCEGSFTAAQRAAATTMAAKKAITSAIEQGIYNGVSDPLALLHDGQEDAHSSYFQQLRKQAAMDFDTSFERGICPVHLTFLRGADRTYPQSNAADYIAGYLRESLSSSRTIADLRFDNLYKLDPSWVRTAGQPVPQYKLKEFRPIREDEIKSRVLSWILGKGIPPDPNPTTHDPFRDLVERNIPDSTVQEYLLSVY